MKKTAIGIIAAAVFFLPYPFRQPIACAATEE
jgi:hypothetical protein